MRSSLTRRIYFLEGPKNTKNDPKWPKNGHFWALFDYTKMALFGMKTQKNTKFFKTEKNKLFQKVLKKVYILFVPFYV